ncbi:dienelactone hydrolase family protein [Plantactinospora siamensis]|uniref:Dienelactone hydrolase family protein n=1 Tax=Plantactinospora siamensis TaxID=555372 RepID=A0ABV6P4S4_9ACTN
MRDAMRAGTVQITGADGDEIEAYVALPDSPGSFGGVVVIHHLPGYDEATKEITRRLASYGYQAICPNLYSREARGADPDDAAAIARANGGIPDDRLVGDVEGAAAYLKGIPGSNGRIGVIGFCSGGRQAFLAAVRLPLQAAVDCYGAFVVGNPPDEFPLAVTPLLDQADRLSCPLLGLFGADDRYPSTDQVQELDRELDRLGKQHEFHTYPDAGHAFLAVDRPTYRPAAAVDAWRRIRDFFDRTLTA